MQKTLVSCWAKSGAVKRSRKDDLPEEEGLVKQKVPKNESNWKSMPKRILEQIVKENCYSSLHDIWLRRRSASFRLVCKDWKLRHDHYIWMLEFSSNLPSANVLVKDIFPNLTKLSFNKCGPNFLAPSRLLCVRGLKIEHVSLSSSDISDDHLKAVATSLHPITSLKSLNLDYSEVTSAGLKSFSSATNLECLSLNYCREVTRELSFLSTLTSLKSLSLPNCPYLVGYPVENLAKAQNITELDFSESCKMGDPVLIAAGLLPKLSNICLTACWRITDAGLMGLSKSKSLKAVILAQCQDITNKGVCALAKCRSITSLDLSCCNVSDVALKAIAKLTSLKHLDLDTCEKVTDKGLVSLSPLVSLEFLSVDNCEKIKGAGFEALVTMSSLKELSLQETGVTDQGLVHIGKLMTLEGINLKGCEKITDSGLMGLASLSNLQRLLLTEYDKITESGIDALRAAAASPSLKIHIEDDDM